MLESLEGKFKLSQDKPAADRERVIEPLVGLLLKDGGQIEEAIWDALKVLTNLHEYEELRKRVAREKAGTRPVVKTYKKKDVSPDWWRDQD